MFEQVSMGVLPPAVERVVGQHGAKAPPRIIPDEPTEVMGPWGRITNGDTGTESFPAEDARLVAACLEGDEAACARLYYRHYTVLMPICMRYARDTDEAKDILQEGFIRIFTNLASYTGKGSFVGWLKRVMVNTAINHYRSGSMERASFLLNNADRALPEAVGSMGNEALSRMTVDELLRLVRELPNAYRMVFNLRVIEGWSHKEIGKELGISEATSKSNLSRARAKLMDRVKHLYPTGTGK